MVSGWSIILVDYSMENWISIIIGEHKRDRPSILIPSHWVVRSNATSGGIKGTRDRDVARSRGVVVAVFACNMGFTFVPYTLFPVFGSMFCRHRKLFQLISRRSGRGKRWGSCISRAGEGNGVQFGSKGMNSSKAVGESVKA